ncbi:MAG: hypothetical protein KBC64_01855 [Simkaniaceae bacterium]|nr:hypothetical protein [Simkaniaceae bacterium]
MPYPETIITPSRTFFDLAYHHFQDSLLHTEEIRRYYQLANLTFCLRFAGNAMVDTLTRALKHLEITQPDSCSLTICLWDSQSTHTPCLAFPWASHTYDMRGEVIQYNSDQIYTVVDIHTKVLHLFDQERQLALYWINDSRDLPWWVGGSPLQLILHWWMRVNGHQLTHAAAVGFPEGCVVLAGKSGAGKSTTTLACMDAGMHYISEDYCLLSQAPESWAYSVYNSAKIEDKTLEWFPKLKNHLSNPHRRPGEKAFFFHHEFQPKKIIAGGPVKALITLKIEATVNSWLEPIHSHQALAALSATTLWQLTHTGPAVFLHLKQVAESLPCYFLHLGSDLRQAPKLIEALL